jgi:hypothetical protein
MKKYNISVLLPTRGRTDALQRSVQTLIDHAHKIDNVQIMFGFDRDDQIGLDYFKNTLCPELDRQQINYLALQFDRLGYINIDKYYNQLAKKADADWFFIWNDDAFMITDGWDQVIEKYTGQLKVLKVHTHNEHPYSIFPIVPSAWLDVLGYLSGHQMNDAWISQIGYMMNLIEIVDIDVTHDRHDLTGNNADSTYDERVYLEGKPHDPADFHHPETTRKRLIDCEKLAVYMKAQGQNIEWWEAVKSGKQDPWEKLKINDINKQMMQFNLKLK